MRFKHDPEPSFQVFKMLNTNSSSHQARHTVAPLVVQAFNEAGLTAAFTTGPVLPGPVLPGPVLPGPEQLGIRFVEVGINQFAAVARRKAEPKLPQTGKRAISNPKANHLMR